MRLMVPNPVAVVAAVTTAVELVPRAARALDRVEVLLDRLESLTDRGEAVVGSAEQVVERSDLIATKASRAVDQVTGVSDRVDAALTPWEPVMRSMLPKVSRFSKELSDSEIGAAISLVDRLPLLLEHVEQDVLPVLRNLDRVGPDLHEVLEIVEDLRRIITGLPGVGLLRRRSDDEPPKVDGSVHDHN